MFRIRGRWLIALLTVVASLSFALPASAVNGNAGLLNSTFTANFAANGGPYMFGLEAAEQPDGKIVLGGEGATRIKRLNADGTLDAAFQSALGTGFNDTVTSVAIHPDGGIIVGGIFTAFNGVTVGPVVRLTSSGALDGTFSANARTVIGQPLNFGFARVQAVAVSSGKIYVGGELYGGTAGTVNLVRLNNDGTLANSYYPYLDGQVVTILPLPNGNTLIGGAFSGWGISPKVMMIDSSDQVDTTFGANLKGTAGGTPNGDVIALGLATNGDIYLGGSFTSFGSAPVGRLARVSPTGVLNTTFNSNIGTGPDDNVNSIVPQLDGNVFAVGNFMNFNGTSVGMAVELNADGTRNSTFMGNFGTGFDNFHSYAIGLSTGDILAFGRFGRVNTVSVSSLAAIQATPTYTVRYNSNGGSGSVPTNQTFLTSTTIASGSGLTRSGYTFGGWNTAQAGNGTPIAAGSTYSTAADLTAWAKWSPLSYTVTYSTGMGGSSVSAGSYSTGSSFTAASAPTRSGYTFANWTITDSDSSTHTVNAAASYAPVGFGNVTAAANWNPNSYTVTYSTGTGGSSVSAGSYSTGGTFTAATAPTRSGYSFTNWTITDSDSSTHTVNAGASYTPVGLGNITAEANWTASVPAPSASATNGSTGLAYTGISSALILFPIVLLIPGFLMLTIARRNAWK